MIPIIMVMMMPSNDYGKTIVVDWIRKNFPPDSKILDVGACDGKWRNLLPEYTRMDAVERFPPNAEAIAHLYGKVFCTDVAKLHYGFYDLVIFGDVIEHMEVHEAQMALRYAKRKSRDVLIAVPFLYPQNEIYGNPYERHIQDDLTDEVFKRRYPGFKVLHDTQRGYCYYIRGDTDE